MTTRPTVRAPRTKLEIWKCTGGPGERWTYGHDELKHGSLCLDDKGNGGNGSLAVLYGCGTSAGELWHHASNGEWLLALHGGKLCLTGPNLSAANGTRLTIATCHDKPGQVWTKP